jgi:hypothetical protein
MRVMVSGGPFGHEQRRHVIDRYLSSAGTLTPEGAWVHVYRLLLWIDPTNGLVHAYESDKSQPGRYWHSRALRVTARLAEDFGVPVPQLRDHIDILFRDCLAELVRREDGRERGKLLTEAEDVEAEDPDTTGLVAVIEQIVGPEQHATAVRIADAARKHLAVENKRKNILGEGLEDVLGVLIERIAGVPASRMKLRAPLSGLPGYRAPASRRKEKRPDIAIFEGGRRTEMLISSKWSVRADREDQLADEYQFYIDHQTQDAAPEKVLITNEFDRARLASAVESPRFRFDRVVHIQPGLLATAYGDEIGELGAIIRQRKLISLGDFLKELRSRFAA